LRALSDRLGVKPQTDVLVISAPDDYDKLLGQLPEGVRVSRQLESSFNLIHLFVKSRARLEVIFPNLKSRLRPNGALWVSWPKRASGNATDLSESAVMSVGLSNGLVDIKVIAVNEVWSALKFVYRTNDR
jgi:hypothetical protein